MIFTSCDQMMIYYAYSPYNESNQNHIVMKLPEKWNLGENVFVFNVYPEYLLRTINKGAVITSPQFQQSYEMFY